MKKFGKFLTLGFAALIVVGCGDSKKSSAPQSAQSLSLSRVHHQ